mgnify:CR=1 FL=1|tara:strand:+ start:4811 stop:5017 length:207 start_codon:yes stop_codon:yes gene_type:complete
MKKGINIKVLLLGFGLIIALVITLGSNKPVNKPIQKVIVYKYVKVQDWKSKKNPKKIEYYEHLYNTSK